MKCSFLFSTFISLVFFVNIGLAQADQVYIKKVLPPEGAWQFISGIIQDAKGNMWFATNNGLFKYNGINFTTYVNDPLNPSSLASTNVISICLDSKGNVWVGSDAGLSKLDPLTGVFTNYRTIPADTTSLGGASVHSLLEDREGYIWAGTNKGVDRLDTKTGKFSHFYSRENDPTSITSGEVTEIYQDKQGTLWIGTGTPFRYAKPGEGGLNKFNKATNTFTRYVHSDNDSTSLIDSRVRAIFEDSKGNFWVGTVGDGLHTMDRSKGTFKRYTYNPGDPSKLSRTPLKTFGGWDDFVSFINEDASGIIWIGTCNGMNRYDQKTGKTTYYSPEKNNPLSVLENIFWCSYSSRDGVFWIGDVSTSIFKIDILHSNIPYYSLGVAANSVYQEFPGTFWAGTEGKGLLQCDENGRVQTKFMHDPSNPASISNDHIFIIRKDTGQKLWIGTDIGLNLFDIKTQKFISYKNDPNNKNSLGSNSINYVYEDIHKNFWIGTQYTGLELMDRKTGTFTHYPHDAEDSTSLGGSYVSSICEDNRGRLLVGIFEGGGGVNRRDEKTGKFFHYLKGSNITYLYRDHRGVVWVATRAILYYFDVEADKMVPFTIAQTGNYFNNVLSVIEDKRNNLWLCTGTGIIRLDSSRKKIAIYGERYRVQKNEFGYSDGMVGSEGNIIFCDQMGYYSFFPDKIITNPRPPEVMLTDFMLQDQSITASKNSVLEKPLMETDEIHLNHKQNFFSFGFNVVDYSGRTNDFLFMLENYDNKWRKGNEDLSASYFNVQPGEYTFRVKVINSDGLTTEKQIRIIISPPWWETWWFRVLSVIALGIVIYSIVKERSRKLKTENTLLEEKVNERTYQLQKVINDLKSTQAQLIQSEKMASLGELTAGIAHEIQNPLNFVNNFSEVSNELVDEMNEELNKGDIEGAKTISSNIKQNLEKINHHGRRADAIVKGMLQHSRASSGQKQPTDINALCDEYLRLAYHGLRAKDKNFNATTKTDFDISIDKINVVPQDIGRVLLNLINNAFYAVNEKAKQHDAGYEPAVSVATKKLNNKVEIKVSDNGNGIAQNVVDKIFQPFFTTKPTGEGTGLGLSLTYDIIKAHGGEIKLGNNSGNGCSFTIEIPVK